MSNTLWELNRCLKATQYALYPEVDSPGCHSTNVERRGLCAERRAWAQSAALVAVAPIHLPPRPASSSPTLPLELKVHPALEPPCAESPSTCWGHLPRTGGDLPGYGL